METYLGESMRAYTEATIGWLQFWTTLTTSAVENQRTAVAALTPPTGGDQPEESPLASIDYRQSDWSFERSVHSRDAIDVGDTITFTKQISDDDVRAFARASGDTNRLHLDEEFAKGTRFGGRIVHGTLVSGLISAALAHLPGLTIYLSQDLRFLRPVEIGQTMTANCEVVEDLGDTQFRLTTIVLDEDDQIIVDGEAVVLIDPLPESTPEE